MVKRRNEAWFKVGVEVNVGKKEKLRCGCGRS